MSEMVERVAKALGSWVHADDIAIEQAARAAIEAMREPTDEMAAAPNIEVTDQEHLVKSQAKDVWRAMIGAALK